VTVPPSRPLPDQRALGVRRIKPAYDQVADQLRDLILGGGLIPGERLPNEPELATAFGVSRGTVREALRLLSSVGLIQTTRGVSGGTFVSEADPRAITDFLETSFGLLSGTDAVSVEELLEARALLEIPAARLAAERRQPEHLEGMRLAIAEEQAASERGARFRHHHHFHSVLLEAAGNRLLTVMTVPVFRVIRSRFLAEREPEFWHGVDDDHGAILSCIEDGDASGAATAMERHLTRLRETYGRQDP